MSERLVQDPLIPSTRLPEPGTPAHEWAESLLANHGTTTGETTGATTGISGASTGGIGGLNTSTTTDAASHVPASSYGATTGTATDSPFGVTSGITTGAISGATPNTTESVLPGVAPGVVTSGSHIASPPSYNPLVPHPNDPLITPGLELPGAYPREYIPAVSSITPGDTLAETARSAADIASTVAVATANTVSGFVETARQYLPAQEEVNRGLSTAAETAKQYLPESVHGYLPGTASTDINSNVTRETTHTLPSQEMSGEHHFSTGGVGTLPGAISEAGVAKLPEERALDGTLNTSGFEPPAIKTTTNILTPPPTIQSPSTYSINAQAGSRPASFIERADETPTPGLGGGSVGVGGHHGALGGVGDLPGSRTETGVAVLPDERNENKTSNSFGAVAGQSSALSGAAGGPLPTPETGESIHKTAYSGTPGVNSSSTQNAATDFGQSLLDKHENQSGTGSTPGVTNVAQNTAEKFENKNLDNAQSNADKFENRGGSGAAVSTGDSNTDSTQRDTSKPTPKSTSDSGLASDQHDTSKDTTTRTEEKSNNNASNADIVGGTKTDKVHEAKEKVKDVVPGSGGADDHKDNKSKAKTEAKNGPPEGFDGYGEGYHPADLHPATGGAEHTDSSAADAGHTSTKASEDTTTAAHSQDDASHEKEKTGTTSSSGGSKIGFMSKLKGEAKIIAGKIGRNEEKVEAGRKLMGKE